MAGNGSKWLTGCGIGCGAVLLVTIALGTAGYFFVKSRMQPFKVAETEAAELRRRYGRVEDYCPEPGGILPAERIRVFLEVRNRFAPARRSLEGAFGELSAGIRQAKEGQDSIPQVLGLIGRGFGVIPQLGEFQAARARALLDTGMGAGEYFYIYVLVYYSWLGKSPGDGPEFRIQGQRGVVSDEPGNGRDVREERLEQLTRHVRRVFLAMLHNRRSKSDEGRAEAAEDNRRDALDAEISALEKNRSRLPWQDGLPAVLENSLKPFREKLVDSYSPLLNPLELELR